MKSQKFILAETLGKAYKRKKKVLKIERKHYHISENNAEQVQNELSKLILVNIFL